MYINIENDCNNLTFVKQKAMSVGNKCYTNSFTALCCDSIHVIKVLVTPFFNQHI